jgi:hypothetical protein
MMHILSRYFCVIGRYSLLISVLILVPLDLLAATPQERAVEGMSAQEFDKWMKDASDSYEKKNAKPVLCEKALLSRMKDGKVVYAHTVMLAVGAWTGYDSGLKANRRADDTLVKFEHTPRFIDRIVALVGDRVFLKCKLLERKGYLLTNVRQKKQAAAEFQKAAVLLGKLSAEVEHYRLKCIVELADAYFQTEKRGLSEKTYLEAMTYRWWRPYMPNDISWRMRALYNRACKGVISCRQGNYEALTCIFIHSTEHKEILPILEAAIKNTGRDPKKAPNIKLMLEKPIESSAKHHADQF